MCRLICRFVKYQVYVRSLCNKNSNIQVGIASSAASIQISKAAARNFACDFECKMLLLVIRLSFQLGVLSFLYIWVGGDLERLLNYWKLYIITVKWIFIRLDLRARATTVKIYLRDQYFSCIFYFPHFWCYLFCSKIKTLCDKLILF